MSKGFWCAYLHGFCQEEAGCSSCEIYYRRNELHEAHTAEGQGNNGAGSNPAWAVEGSPEGGALETVSAFSTSLPPPIRTQRCGSTPQEPISAGSITLLRAGIAMNFEQHHLIPCCNPCTPPQKQEAAACLNRFLIADVPNPSTQATVITNYLLQRRARDELSTNSWMPGKHGDVFQKAGRVLAFFPCLPPYPDYFQRVSSYPLFFPFKMSQTPHIEMRGRR